MAVSLTVGVSAVGGGMFNRSSIRESGVHAVEVERGQVWVECGLVHFLGGRRSQKPALPLITVLSSTRGNFFRRRRQFCRRGVAFPLGRICARVIGLPSCSANTLYSKNALGSSTG